MTVPDLRAECKRLGLPTYQVQGRRLRKADLVAQLEGANGGMGRRDGSGFRPANTEHSARVGRECAGQTADQLRQPGDISFDCCDVGGEVDSYGVEPAPARQPQAGRCPARRLADADRLVMQLAQMPTTPAERFALYRTLNGTATAGHDGILRRREARACEVLAARARSVRTERKWLDRKSQCEGTAT